MSVTAYKYPGTVTTSNESGGAGEITDPNNVKVTDTSYAQVATKNGSLYIRPYNFGFTSSNVPTGATIDGIEVVANKQQAMQPALDWKFYLRISTGRVGSNYASAVGWPDELADVTYGGATNKWGTTTELTQSEIVASTFGFDFACYSTGLLYCNINSFKIRVYYTAGAGVSIPVLLCSLGEY